jgi:CheY-like chemotaxis protein
MSTKSVLWLDNDPGYIVGFVSAARRSGIEVVVVRSVTEAEQALSARRFALVIIDVMIPLSAAEQADGYTCEATDDSHKTGLEFYKRLSVRQDRPNEILVLTVRVDQSVRDEFLAAGLPAERFVTKLELHDARAFVAEVKRRLDKG